MIDFHGPRYHLHADNNHICISISLSHLNSSPTYLTTWFNYLLELSTWIHHKHLSIIMPKQSSTYFLKYVRSSFLFLGLICATPSIWFQFSSFLILQISGRLFCPLSSNISFYCYWYFSGGSVGKESTCNAGDARDVASVSGLGRYSGGGHGNPLQYSCLENPMDRGVCQATVRSIAKSWTWLKQPSNTHTHIHMQIFHVWFFPLSPPLDCVLLKAGLCLFSSPSYTQVSVQCLACSRCSTMIFKMNE